MSVEEGRQQIEEAYQELMAKWGRTSSTWRDQQSRDFETRYIEPLRPDIMLAMDALREMRELVTKTEKACE